ncbi:MAG: PilW family protein [Candidatus Thiodiazotropha sp.]
MRPLNTSQTGFSIISLLVASAIGLFLISGIITVYIDSKNSFNARTAISTTTENLRFAIQDLRRTIVMTGRGVPQRDDNVDAYPPSGADNGFRSFPATGDYINIDSDANGNSVIAIRYADGPAPCGLAGTLDGGTATVRFFINDDNELVCAATGPFPDYEQPLVSDIVAMRVLYGMDRDDEDTAADKYLSASAMDNEEWNFVVSMRIGLVAGSGEANPLPNNFRESQPQTLDLLGAEYDAPDTEFFYKASSTTISLRNRNGIVQRQ